MFKNLKINDLVITNLVQYLVYGGKFDTWVETRTEILNLSNVDIIEIKLYINKEYGIDVYKINNIDTNLTEAGKSLLDTFKSSIKNIVKGKRIKADKSLAEERMSICKQCPLFNKKTNQCGKCRCYLKNKTSTQTAKCPLNKW